MTDPVDQTVNELRDKLLNIEKAGNEYCAARAYESRQLLEGLVSLLIERLNNLVPKAKL